MPPAGSPAAHVQVASRGRRRLAGPAPSPALLREVGSVGPTLSSRRGPAGPVLQRY